MKYAILIKTIYNKKIYFLVFTPDNKFKSLEYKLENILNPLISYDYNDAVKILKKFYLRKNKYNSSFFNTIKFAKLYKLNTLLEINKQLFKKNNFKFNKKPINVYNQLNLNSSDDNNNLEYSHILKTLSIKYIKL